jgi:hypothetical protein
MSSNLRLAAVALVILVSRRCLANAGNEPHGVLANEARLKGLIKQTVHPKPVAHRPLPADVQALLAWSKRPDSHRRCGRMPNRCICCSGPDET